MPLKTTLVILFIINLWRWFQRSVHFITDWHTSSSRDTFIVERHFMGWKDGLWLRLWQNCTNRRVHLRKASVCWRERLIYSGWSSNHLVFLRLLIGRTGGVHLPLWWWGPYALLAVVRIRPGHPGKRAQLSLWTGYVYGSSYFIQHDLLDDV